MNEWQSIETAPKDGRPILAALVFVDPEVAESIYTQQCVIRWHDRWNEWVPEFCLMHLYNSGDEWDDVHPSHWMPLPTPPQLPKGPG